MINKPIIINIAWFLLYFFEIYMHVQVNVIFTRFKISLLVRNSYKNVNYISLIEAEKITFPSSRTNGQIYEQSEL